MKQALIIIALGALAVAFAAVAFAVATSVSTTPEPAFISHVAPTTSIAATGGD